MGSHIKPHIDLREIETALEFLLSTKINPQKINLGIANYGRGYTVADATCAHSSCEFEGPSKAGECTNLEGILSLCEINRIISEKGLTPQLMNGGAELKVISWNNQWVGYDDKETLRAKQDYANSHCLGGTALWAVDYSVCSGRYVILSSCFCT